jgi:hypothetical protein
MLYHISTLLKQRMTMEGLCEDSYVQISKPKARVHCIRTFASITVTAVVSNAV